MSTSIKVFAEIWPKILPALDGQTSELVWNAKTKMMKFWDT
jgi:hypothetical protein